MNVFNLKAQVTLDTNEYKRDLKNTREYTSAEIVKLKKDWNEFTTNTAYRLGIANDALKQGISTQEEYELVLKGIKSAEQGFIDKAKEMGVTLPNVWKEDTKAAKEAAKAIKEQEKAAQKAAKEQAKAAKEAKTFSQQVVELQKKWKQVEIQNKANLAVMKSLFNQGVISAKQYKQAVSDASAKEQELFDKAKEIGVELPEDFDKAGEAMSGAAESASVSWAAVAQVVVKLIGYMKQLVTDSIEYADNVAQIAKQYGMTTDSVSELQYIASQTHTDISNITSAMTQLERKAINEGEVFQELGISVKTANGDFKSMEELFFDTIGTLSDLSDEEEKSAYMVQLFGRTTMESGELFRLTREQIAGLRTEANELGIVMSEQAVATGEDISKRWEALKLQAKSAIAEMLLGDEGEATEKFDNLLEDLLEVFEKFAPRIISFAVKLFVKVWIEIQKQSPSLISELIQTLLDMIFEVDWWQVGIDIGKATVEGILNIVISALNKLLGWLGVEIPEVDLGVSAGGNYFKDFDTKNEYEITEHKTEEVTVKIEASGDTDVDENNARKTAEALAPYIDEILGAK